MFNKELFESELKELMTKHGVSELLMKEGGFCGDECGCYFPGEFVAIVGSSEYELGNGESFHV